jgi:MATE family multidrug resistance protein
METRATMALALPIMAGMIGPMLMGVVSALLLGCTGHHLTWLGQSAEVVREGSGYILLTALSLIPVMVAYSIKHFGEAVARPWKPMIIFTLGVLLNILLNWMFIFGH